MDRTAADRTAEAGGQFLALRQQRLLSTSLLDYISIKHDC
jgi:hypothetical protein